MEGPNFLAFIEYETDFAMATAAETQEAMRKAGFTDVTAADRDARYAGLSAQQVRGIEGPLRDRAIEILGEARFEEWPAFRRVMAATAKSGSLRLTHLRARRPG